MLSKTKFIFVSLLVSLFLLVGVANAATSSDLKVFFSDQPSSIDESSNSFTFKVEVEYSGTSENMTISFADSTTSVGSISIPDITGLNGSISESKEVTGTVSSLSNQGGKTAQVVINVTTSDGERDDTESFSVRINEEIQMCEFGERGDLEITDISIDNEGEGSNDEWEPLDPITIEVEVENTDNDDDVEDVHVEIFVYDDRNNDVTDDFDFDDEKIDLGKIKDGDAETATFEFDEVPADLDEGDYKMYLKAYSDGEEDEHCTSETDEHLGDSEEYSEIELVREEEYAVIVKREDLANSILASCGDTDVRVEFSVYNIGLDKEEGVLVNLYNSELGIDEYVSLGSLRSGKKEDATFFIDVPEQVSRENYKLKVFTYFDYDEDEDEMEESSYDRNSIDDLDKNWDIDLEILSCASPRPTITALLDSAAQVGEELVIKTTITNQGDSNNFVVSVSGIEGWAETISITPQTLTLGDKESGEVSVRLNPITEGFHSFSINTISNGETYSQPVSVNIAEEPGVFNSLKLDENVLYYVVGALVILIILILLLIVIRLSRKKKQRF